MKIMIILLLSLVSSFYCDAQTFKPQVILADGVFGVSNLDEDNNTISLFENSLISNVLNYDPNINYSYTLDNNIIRLNTTENSLNYQMLSSNGNQIKNGSFSSEHLLSIDNIPIGIYFLRVFNSTSSRTHKFFRF